MACGGIWAPSGHLVTDSGIEKEAEADTDIKEDTQRRVQLGGRGRVWCVQGPGVDPQHQKENMSRRACEGQVLGG